jgi:hypothetical protein
VLLLYLEQAIAATRNDGLALTSDMLVGRMQCCVSGPRR